MGDNFMKINWKIFREIIYLAIPAVGEMTLYMMIWIFDTMMIGKYGGQLAVSSVGLSTEIIYSFFNIIIAVGVSTALTSLISRAIGSKDYKKAEIIANAGIKIAVVLAFIFFSLLLKKFNIDSNLTEQDVLSFLKKSSDEAAVRFQTDFDKTMDEFQQQLQNFKENKSFYISKITSEEIIAANAKVFQDISEIVVNAIFNQSNFPIN